MNANSGAQQKCFMRTSSLLYMVHKRMFSCDYMVSTIVEDVSLIHIVFYILRTNFCVDFTQHVLIYILLLFVYLLFFVSKIKFHFNMTIFYQFIVHMSTSFNVFDLFVYIMVSFQLDPAPKGVSTRSYNLIKGPRELHYAIGPKTI